jgi:hypothetical protein
VTVASSSTDFIGELCVALRHRWLRDELFVIFTSYFDEADTHGPSPTVILAGYLGHAFQWRRFEKKLTKLRAKHNFKIFHSKEFKARTKGFDGWSDTQCNNLVDDLTDMMEKTLSEGFAMALERDRYLNEYRSPPIPRKMNLDSQYGVCFRSCMFHLMDRMSKRGYRDRLNVVIEDGHPNVYDCGRIFGDLKRRYERLGINVLGSFTIEQKQSCPPLMLADYMAGAYSIMRETMSLDDMDAQSGHIHIDQKIRGRTTYMELQPDGLQGLKDEFERLRQRDIEKWRADRDARKASSEEKQSS